MARLLRELLHNVPQSAALVLAEMPENALAYVVRVVLTSHLRQLAEGELCNRWPADTPQGLAGDLSIGEISALDHCDDVAARLATRLCSLRAPEGVRR